MPETLARPNFVIIGSMKSATTTLHDQLARLPGVFMSTPKEPNFFSDDPVWANGLAWYRSLFEAAPPDAICGESSTHYTKLPTHPHAVARIRTHLPEARLIYVMRDPIDRLVSQYIHEWSVQKISVPIDRAVREFPELIAYSCYCDQIRPWLEAFGADRVLPVFFERLTKNPQPEFERVCRFIGYPGEARWTEDAAPKNVSSQRVRRSPVRDRILAVGIVKKLRRTLLSEDLRRRIKSRWQMTDRPTLSAEARAWCVAQLTSDTEQLGKLLGLSLACEGFAATVTGVPNPPDWASLEGHR